MSTHTSYFAAVLSAVVFIESPIIGAMIFLLWSMRYASLVPVLDPKFQDLVPEKIRATIGSVRNAAGALAMLAADFLCLIFADSLGARNMLLLAGIIMLPAAFLYVKIEKSARIEEETWFVQAGNGRVLSLCEAVLLNINSQFSKELIFAPVVKIPRACGKRNSDDKRLDPGMYLVPRIYPPLP